MHKAQKADVLVIDLRNQILVMRLPLAPTFVVVVRHELAPVIPCFAFLTLLAVEPDGDLYRLPGLEAFKSLLRQLGLS